LGLLMMSCETTKPGAGEFGSPNPHQGRGGSQARQPADSTGHRQRHWTFKTPRAELAAAFIREFGDGTVIDKILVRKAPAGPKDPVNYYLVGMGLRNGMFRAMALPLTNGGDNTVYLRPTAERYIITSVGCPACYFNFEGGRIVSTTCAENSGGSRCDMKVVSNNALFAAAR
jgi:hypothetical protein